MGSAGICIHTAFTSGVQDKSRWPETVGSISHRHHCTSQLQQGFKMCRVSIEFNKLI